MLRSAGVRFLVVAVLGLLMLIPLLMVSDVVSSRRTYHTDVLDQVGEEWGGKQVIAGPMLVLPVTEDVVEQRKRDVIDPATGRVMVHEASGLPVQESYEVTVPTARDPVVLLPGQFTARLSTRTELRHRGIFDVPVYQATVEMEFDFPLSQAEKLLVGAEKVDWAGAQLVARLQSNRALRGAASLKAGNTDFGLEPRNDDEPGLSVALNDPRGHDRYALRLDLNGADSLRIAPVGRTTKVEMRSDWPHPSFDGAFLPNTHDITDTGFVAEWMIPHLARNLAQASRMPASSASDMLRQASSDTSFGFSFYQPNDFYQKAWRASKYGLLTVALTFLTVFLIEGRRETPLHPVQYILIGLAQAIFILLMLAYAEQIGFGPAYALSAGATTLLLTAFGVFGLRLGRRAAVLGLMLGVLYAVLYLILQSTDYALLAGASLAFLALGATMYSTRNEEWYGPTGSAGWLLRQKPVPPPLPDAAPPQSPPLP